MNDKQTQMQLAQLVGNLEQQTGQSKSQAASNILNYVQGAGQQYIQQQQQQLQQAQQELDAEMQQKKQYMSDVEWANEYDLRNRELQNNATTQMINARQNNPIWQLIGQLPGLSTAMV